MSRLLAVITPGDEAIALASMTGLVTVARAAEAEVRLAYFRELPSPRFDKYDHLVADTDAEMTRLASVATQALGSAARVYDDVKVETVVRFGPPRREVATEAEVYGPQIIVLFAAARGLLARLRSWMLRRHLAARPASRILILEPTPRPVVSGSPIGEPVLTPPARLPARRE